MVKKKKEEKTEKTLKKKTINEKTNVKRKDIEIEKFSISELLEKNNIKPLNAVGFLNYYNLSEEFKKEFETRQAVVKFSEGEFNNMYERYIKRGM